jgi:microcystin-dependent protein
MPRQSDGTFTQLANTAAVFGNIIDPVEFNILTGDYDTEITNSLDRNGRGAMLADLDAGSFRVKNIANPTAAQDAAPRQYVLNQVIYNFPTNAQTVTGTDTIVATFTPPLTSYGHGMRVYFRAVGANTTSLVTFAPDALAAKTVYRSGYHFGTLLSPGDIPDAGFWACLTYDAGLNSGAGGFSMEPWDRTPTGTIKMMANAIAPPGYLLCNGASLARSTYSNLFAAISTLYGSVDGSHFNLPTLGGRFPRFLDGGIGLDPGRTMGSLQGQQFQDHTHSAFLPGTTTGVSGPGAFLVPSQGFTQNTGLSSSGTAGTETRPVNIALYGIIKL